MYIQNLQPGMVDTMSYVTVMADKTGKLILKVLDIDGHIAKTLEANVAEGKQQLEINLGDLVSGRYVLNAFSGGNFIKSIRFVKQ
jgi:hypothetical protein